MSHRHAGLSPYPPGLFGGALSGARRCRVSPVSGSDGVGLVFWHFFLVSLSLCLVPPARLPNHSLNRPADTPLLGHHRGVFPRVVIREDPAQDSGWTLVLVWLCPRPQFALSPVLSPGSVRGLSPRGLGYDGPVGPSASPRAPDLQVPADPAPEPGLPGHDRRLQPEHAVPAPCRECPQPGARGRGPALAQQAQAKLQAATGGGGGSERVTCSDQVTDRRGGRGRVASQQALKWTVQNCDFSLFSQGR